jgi:glycosyltransferase involved in cell wall biosynthesis
MRVSFDSQIFCLQEFGGISRYFASLARELNQMPGINAEVVAPFYVNEYLDKLPEEAARGRRLKGKRIPKPLLTFASALLGEAVFWRTRPDVVHETYYYPRLRGPRCAPRVVSVYDMNYERYPELFPKNVAVPRWKRRAVESADHVICISHHTKRDLMEFCGVPESKISVTHLAHDPIDTLLPPSLNGQPSAPRHAGDRPYLLYVGSRTGCKNFARLLRALASSIVIRDSYRLLCFGGGAFTPDELSLIHQLGLSGCVSQTGGDDACLAACYRDAALFVYPSLYEGFGIPPLEAMALNCPVACSNASSIPEVVGSAAALFDPTDVDDMRSVLETVLTTESTRNALVELGRVRCAMFSWQRCARETVAIYEKVLAR